MELRPIRVLSGFGRGDFTRRVNHTEVIFELSDLREVKVDRSYVQLDFLSGGLFVVPESAFENASERDRFVVAVREG
jgi:hypothetical protein